MKIFIMRHGEAETFAASDSERNLTKRGVSQSRLVARACCEQGFSEFDLVLVSPYVRAQQTWQEISGSFNVDPDRVEECGDITPYGDSEEVYHYVKALAEVRGLESVLLVSHLPLVGYLTAEFVTGMAPPMFPTSGLACVEFDVEKEQGELLWHIHP